MSNIDTGVCQRKSDFLPLLNIDYFSFIGQPRVWISRFKSRNSMLDILEMSQILIDELLIIDLDANFRFIKELKK